LYGIYVLILYCLRYNYLNFSTILYSFINVLEKNIRYHNGFLAGGGEVLGSIIHKLSLEVPMISKTRGSYSNGVELMQLEKRDKFNIPSIMT